MFTKHSSIKTPKDDDKEKKNKEKKRHGSASLAVRQKASFLDDAQRKVMIYFATAAVVVGLAGYLLIAMTGMRMSGFAQARSVMTSQGTVEITQPRLLEIAVYSDKQPVDVQAISPTGQVFDETNAISYTQEAGSTIMAIKATEAGTWDIECNRLANSRLQLAVRDNYLYETFIQNASATIDGDTCTVSFSPLYGDGSEHGSVHMQLEAINKITGESTILTFGECLLNTENKVEIDATQLPSSWTLRLSTHSQNGDAMYEASVEMEVK